MDLDNIKKTWNDNLFTPTLTEDRIHHIISRKSKTTLGSLLWFELIGLIVVLPFMAAPYIHALYFPRMPYPEVTKYFFISCCVISFFWQIYKVRLLRSIDLEKSDIISNFNTISRYKLYIKRELFIAIPCLTIFLVTFCYDYIDIISEEGKMQYYLINLVILLIAIVVMIIFYKLFYKKNIENIESAFKEIKEMEKE